MTKQRIKKQRGRRAKQRAAHILSSSVSVSEITEDGFRISMSGKDIYVQRKKFPCFVTATDEALQDVYLCSNVDEYHGDVLIWKTLGVDLSMRHLEKGNR